MSRSGTIGSDQNGQRQDVQGRAEPGGPRPTSFEFDTNPQLIHGVPLTLTGKSPPKTAHGLGQSTYQPRPYSLWPQPTAQAHNDPPLSVFKTTRWTDRLFQSLPRLNGATTNTSQQHPVPQAAAPEANGMHLDPQEDDEVPGVEFWGATTVAGPPTVVEELGSGAVPASEHVEGRARQDQFGLGVRGLSGKVGGSVALRELEGMDASITDGPAMRVLRQHQKEKYGRKMKNLSVQLEAAMKKHHTAYNKFTRRRRDFSQSTESSQQQKRWQLDTSDVSQRVQRRVLILEEYRRETEQHNQRLLQSLAVESLAQKRALQRKYEEEQEAERQRVLQEQQEKERQQKLLEEQQRQQLQQHKESQEHEARRQQMQQTPQEPDDEILILDDDDEDMPPAKPTPPTAPSSSLRASPMQGSKSKQSQNATRSMQQQYMEFGSFFGGLHDASKAPRGWEEVEEGDGEEAELSALLEQLAVERGASDELPVVFNEAQQQWVWRPRKEADHVQKPKLGRIYRQALVGPDNEKLAHHKVAGISITRKQLRCMHPNGWLNDEVINIYMALLQDRDVRLRCLAADAVPQGSSPSSSHANRAVSTTAGAGGGGTVENGAGPGERRKWGGKALPTCHFMNSFFVNKLCATAAGYRYQDVRRWTTSKRLASVGQPSGSVLELDLVVVPVHLGNHWVLAVLYMQEGRLEWYDSLKGYNRHVSESLLRWVRDENQDKAGRQVDTSTWQVVRMDHLPGQENGWDCGMFALMHANVVSLQRPEVVGQDDMQLQRQRVVADILRQRVGW